MTAVPAETPVTTPKLLTVATAVLPDAHGVVGCAVAEPLNVLVAPTQADRVPPMVGTLILIVTLAQPVVVPLHGLVPTLLTK